jgi:outer membrane receptor for ferrienterochelin and colicin
VTRRHFRGRTFTSRFAATSIAALLGLSLSARVAHAGEKEEARRHYKAGMEAIQNGQYDKGVEELKAAYDILPHPNVLYNIARAYAESGDLEKALETYRQYLTFNPPDKDEVEGVVRAIEARLSKAKAAAAAAAVAAASPAATTTPPATGTGEEPAEGTPAEPRTAGGSKPAGTPTSGEPSVAAPGEGELGKLKDTGEYDESVSTASKAAQSPLDSPNSTYVITEQDIRLSGVTTVPELLRRVPGMDFMQVTPTDYDLSIRGFDGKLSNKLLVLVDGRSVYLDFLGTTFWDTLTIGVEDIERIEVVRGPGSALYGADAFAGVVNIITKAPGEGKSGVSAAVGTQKGAPLSSYHGTLSLTGRVGEWNYRASAGFDQVPRWSREVAPTRVDITFQGQQQNVATTTERVDLRFTRRLSKDVLFGIGTGVMEFGARDFYGIGPLTDLTGRGQIGDVTTYVTSPNWNFRAFWNRLQAEAGLTAAYAGDPNYYFSRSRQNIIDGELEYTTAIKSGEKHGAECGPTAKPDAVCYDLQNDLHVGVGYRFKSIDWTYLDATHSENHFAIYAQDTVHIGEDFLLVGSLRGDYVPYLGKVIPSPRGSIIYKRTKDDAVRLTVGSAFRAPSFLESYLDFRGTTPLTGAEFTSQGIRGDDPTSKTQPERILATEIGYQNQASEYYAFEINAYFNRVSDLIVLSPVNPPSPSTVARGAPSYNPTTGRYAVALGGWANDCQIFNVFGGEASIRAFPITGLDVYASYAYNTSRQTAPAGCQATIEDQRTSHHKVTAGAQIRTKFGLEGAFDVSYVGSQLWSEQLLDFASRQLVYQSFPLKEQITANARVGYRFRTEPLELSLSSTNLTNTIVRDHPFGQLIGRRVMFMTSYRF